MGLLNGKGGGLNPWLALGGLAIADHIINGKEKRVVHVYENEEEDRELRQQERILEKQQAVLERQKEIEKEKTPNNMEYIKERVDKGCDVSMWGIGCFLAFDFALLMGLGGTSNPMYMLGCVACIIVGIVLLKKCFEIGAVKKKYMEYISIIIIQGERNIVNIANEMHKTYDEAYRDILFILSKNFIKGYHIDKNSKMIVLSKHNKHFNRDINDEVCSDTNSKVDSRQKGDKCPACGSDLFVESHGEYYCKYCGTKL